jgi:HPt (histidine-containing phosphotransfer) domain-containing protein
MDQFLDIAKYILPSLVVLATAYLLIEKFLENERHHRNMTFRRESQGLTTPVRLQAYERLTILLERITPGNLISRVHKSGMSAKLLQAELLKAIRTEYEHNLSQQVYVSPGAWELIKNAKEETIKLINTAAINVSDEASGVDLGKLILEVSMNIEKMPTQVALDYVKQEARQLF